MRKELTALREQMSEQNIQWYIVPSEDYHNSEYVHDHFKDRAYLSGFTGSAGTLVVGQDEAYLWTDGRYFLQAEQELDGSGIQLMEMGEIGTPDILDFISNQRNQKKELRVGFDGRRVPASRAQQFQKLPRLTILHEEDLVDKIWSDRPAIEPSTIHDLPLSTVGQTTEEKLVAIREKMSQEGADYLLLTDLMEIAWLLNKRGNDVANTPVFFAFAIVSQDEVQMFTMREMNNFGEEDLATPVAGFQWRKYDEIWSALSELPTNKTIWMDLNTASYACRQSIPSEMKLINKESPLELLKAVKNSAEIESTRQAHRYDGVAMIEFSSWLKNHPAKESLTECSAAAALLEFRKRQPGFLDVSFPTISAYQAHGAIVHYEPTEETDIPLAAEGLLLVDSGGQYQTGTTDITRTYSLGPLTEAMKQDYTLVLKSHIALATATFEPGTTDKDLDVIARAPLAKHGLNFKHGTGHGVGHLLSVHEGPNWISPNSPGCEMLPGMITTDEPGLYITGRFGIRLENELLCVELENGKLGHEALTFCPFDREAIIVDMLTASERAWVDSYHRRVREVMEPLVSADAANWLMNACMPL